MSSFGFDIKNSKDFNNKLREDSSEFMKDTLSSRVAINCAMTAWHLTEWVFHEYFPSDFKDEKEFQAKIKLRCPSLQVMHDISNGTKHYVLKRHKPEVSETGVHDGDFDPADFSDDFNVSCLILTKKDGTILYFLDELKIVLEFWATFFMSDPKTILS
jgi:hypothetical protein